MNRNIVGGCGAAMERYAFLVLLLALPLSQARAELAAPYTHSPTSKDFPNAEVLTLSHEVTYTLHPDGRIDSQVKWVRKILAWHGLDRAGEMFVTYDGEHQDLQIFRAQTFTPEGPMKETQGNGFNAMTPFELEHAPDLADVQTMVITHVGLDLNAVIETEYLITDKEKWRPHLDGSLFLASSDPALSRTITIVVPEEVELKHLISSIGGLVKDAPVIEEGATTRRYTWQFHDVKEDFTSLEGERASLLRPTLFFTTAEDWNTWSTTIGEAVKSASTLSKALSTKVDALIQGALSPEERMNRLHGYVLEGIRAVDYPLSTSDMTLRDAGRVAETRYGHFLERAVLLRTVLNAAGLSAEIALAAPYPYAGDEVAQFPCVSRLNTALLRVDAGGRIYWLSLEAPLSQSSQVDFDGYRGLPLIPGFKELHTLTLAETEASSLEIALTVQVGADRGSTGEGRLSYLGYYAPPMGSGEVEKALRDRAERDVKAVLPGMKVASSTIEEVSPFRCVLRVKLEGTVGTDDGVIALQSGLPASSSLGKAEKLHLPTRATPLHLPFAGKERVSIAFVLPSALRVERLPPTTSQQGTSFTITSGWKLESSRLAYTSEMNASSATLSPSDYVGFRAALLQVKSESGSRVILTTPDTTSSAHEK